MPDSDQVKPYHAKDTAPGQEAADVVAQVLKHAEEREQAAQKKVAPKGPPKWMLPLTLNLGVLALYFLIAQPDFLVFVQVDDPRATQAIVESTRRGIYMEGIQRVEGFRLENGRLPQTLAEAGSGLADQGVEYTRVGETTYILTMVVQDQTIVFDSATDDPAEWVGPFMIPG